MSLGLIIYIVAALPQSAFGAKSVVRSIRPRDADKPKIGAKPVVRVIHPRDADQPKNRATVVRRVAVGAKGHIKDTPESLAEGSTSIDIITTEVHTLEDRVEKLEHGYVEAAAAPTYPGGCTVHTYQNAQACNTYPYHTYHSSGSPDSYSRWNACASYCSGRSPVSGNKFYFSVGVSGDCRCCSGSWVSVVDAYWTSYYCLENTAAPTNAPTTNAPTNSPTTNAPTNSPTVFIPCEVTVYEHWPLGITAGISGLEAAEQAWGGHFPTGATMTLHGTGNHALGALSNLTSSVKVVGSCCKAYGYTTADCSGTQGSPIAATTQLLTGLPAGVVTPATGLGSVWGCNDCAQCVHVTQQC